MCDEYAQKKRDDNENFLLLKTTDKTVYRLEKMTLSEDESKKTHSKMFAGKHVSQLKEGANFSAMLSNKNLFNALKWNNGTRPIEDLLASSLKDAELFLDNLRRQKEVGEDDDEDEDEDDGDYIDSGADDDDEQDGADDDDEQDGEEEEEEEEEEHDDADETGRKKRKREETTPELDAYLYALFFDVVMKVHAYVINIERKAFIPPSQLHTFILALHLFKGWSNFRRKNVHNRESQMVGLPVPTNDHRQIYQFFYVQNPSSRLEHCIQTRVGK